MEKTENWYSIIRFMPDKIRGEILNIGLIMHSPENGELKYQILDAQNDKLRSLLPNDVEFTTYKVLKEYAEYYLQSLQNHESLLLPDSFNTTFLMELNNKFPKEFILSEPTFSRTSDESRLFSRLLDTYIGEEFLKSQGSFTQINTKKYIKNVLEEKKLIGTKVKWNAKLTPIKDFRNMQFNIDFVYKNGVLNLLNAVPSSRDNLNNWFTKVNTVIDTYQKESGIYIFYNENDPINYDNTLKDMLIYLKSKDERIINLDVNSSEFKALCNKIETEGKAIEEFEKELLAM